MPQIPQMSKFGINNNKEDIGKAPMNMTQEDMQQLIHYIGESVLIPEDGAFIALWILTLIDHWNNEHERLIVLTERNFYILRYDFLQCRVRDSRRVGLGQLISVITGPLVFPAKSLMPASAGMLFGPVALPLFICPMAMLISSIVGEPTLIGRSVDTASMKLD
ncbi:unnamed protein product [Schistosoma margrebowiei]|uniref:Uncharacterized protein n=1 Tax=Schistosoma margrebowiei TaxID=48269 RepID=A0A183M0U1_9TREM|nr:unnamed protein product [Schistosoma margrebowiei]